jgi:glycosyltransferase involved in cell wall biosynthesis
MRVFCLIDDLGVAGAQRQLCRTAMLLQQRGCSVTVGSYREPRDYTNALAAAGVRTIEFAAASPLARARAIRRAIRRERPDVVLAFLNSPALYAELSALPSRRWGLVVSERSAVPGPPSWTDRLRRMMHLVADCVVTNSHANRALIERSAPRLKGRTLTIYNTVDLDEFHPLAPRPAPKDDALRLVVAANYRTVKNPIAFAKGVATAVGRDPRLDIRVDWYGDDAWLSAGGGSYRAEVQRLVEQWGLADRFRLHGVTQGIADAYRSSDAVAMPSLYEGLPNTVCEGMACGRPILASAISDVPLLVHPGRNGFLFDPKSAEDIAQAVSRLASLPWEAREAMGRESRVMAEGMFSADRTMDTWLAVLTAAARRERPSAEHWIPASPEWRPPPSDGPPSE